MPHFDMPESVDSLRNSLLCLSKEKLIGIIETLLKLKPKFKNKIQELINEQNTVENHTDKSSQSSEIKPFSEEKRTLSNSKSIDFSKYHQRQIALQLQYDGGSYLGFASQNDEETVEKHLFAALTKLKLIQDRQSCNYSRCGRTDKGVSALGQVVSCLLRSALPKGPTAENADCGSVAVAAAEMDYSTMLNNCLPPGIRVLGWCEVTPQFSARFSAANRSYRYFFLRKDLRIDLMREAASLLVGTHDFRNICKIDTANVSNFVREIYSADVVPYQECELDPGKSVWMLEICGVAFLWHMVRCIMAVLFMVGGKGEDPAVVTHLLDIQRCPSKPTYTMAPDLPLVLNRCGYDNLRMNFQPRSLWSLTAHFEAEWERLTLAAARASNVLDFIKGCRVDVRESERFLEETAAKRLCAQQSRCKRKADGSAVSMVNSTIQRALTGVERCEDSPLVEWRSILQTASRADISLVPEVRYVPHVPLLQRKCEEPYEDKVRNLSGIKKDRLQRHKDISLENVAETPEFFKRMRQEGSLNLALRP